MSKNPIGGSAQKQEPIPPELIDVRAVMRLLGLGERTVWAWSKSGKIPAPIRLSPRKVLWRRCDILRFVENGCQPAQGGAA